MIGSILTKITGLEKESNEVLIYTKDGYMRVYHEQDCCETVELEDFEMSAMSLVGGTILSFEEVSGEIPPDDNYDSVTWTFYKLETTKGGLWMRWCGESNGYYSESVDIHWVSL